MEITPQNLQFFFTGLINVYSQAYGVTEVWHDKFATVYPAQTEDWISGWIGMLDKLREWKGARIIRTPAPQTYRATVRNFELTEGVDKFKLQDDQYGIYTPMFQMMGYQQKKWPDYQLRDLLFNQGAYTGAAQIGTDGVTYFNTAHPIDFYNAAAGTYCNDYRGGVNVNGITVGGAFSVNAFNTVWSDMNARVAENGEKIGIKPNVTAGPAQLRAAMSTVLNNQMFAPPVMGTLGSGPVGTANAPFVGTMTNPLQGWTSVDVIEDFADNSTWFMLDTRMPVKPFGWVLRQAPVMIPRTSPTDPAVFDTRLFLFGVEARGVPVWGLPFLGSVSGPTAV